MKILALEFSSTQRSVAVVQPGRAEEVIEAGSQGPNALGMIAEALRASGLVREQIECLAIGLGPGSYTGIRSAIALAQGWQLALGTRLLGISTVECLATQAREEGYAGKVTIAIDAQRSEFYLASYDLDARDAPGTGPRIRAQTEKGQPIFVARATGICTEPLRLATKAEVQERERIGQLLIGPDLAGWFPHSRAIFPRAAILGQLAQGRTDFVPGEKLEPIYLRVTSFVKAAAPRKLPSSL
jgi:tRNA threonylcarbamoyl adenosine modification protein YeaZ